MKNNHKLRLNLKICKNFKKNDISYTVKYEVDLNKHDNVACLWFGRLEDANIILYKSIYNCTVFLH